MSFAIDPFHMANHTVTHFATKLAIQICRIMLIGCKELEHRSVSLRSRGCPAIKQSI